MSFNKFISLIFIGVFITIASSPANAFITYPKIDPIAFNIFKFPIHWYGLFYLFGLLIVYIATTNYINYYHRNQRYLAVTSEAISDALLNGFILAIVGGRLFYILFYMPNMEWLTSPIKIIAVWEGGMSFHGGLIGALLGVWFTAYRNKISLLQLLDQIAPWAPFAIALGRIANFINDELWGRVTDVPWAVLFPSGNYLPRHPSQLYQAGLEGITVAIILLILSRKNLSVGVITAIGLILFSIARIFIEFFRMPDPQLGYYLNYFTMGQFLSLPMLLGGIILLIYCVKTKLT